MAVTNLEGFENSRFASGFFTVTNGTSNIGFVAGRWGGVAAQGYGTGSGNSPVVSCTPTFPATATAQFGCGAKWGTTSGYATNHQFLRLSEGATVHVAARLNAAGLIELVRGDGTVLATSTVAPVMTVWNHWAIAAVIADGTGGTAAVYLNGVQVCGVTGVDTRNGGTTGLADRGQIITSGMGIGSGFNLQVDDVYTADTTTFLGDCKVPILRPNGVGDSTAWTPSSAVANWTTVDDNSMTDYVGTAVASAKDLYTLTDLPAGVSAVHATQTELLVLKNDTGAAPGSIGEARKSVGGVEETATIVTAAEITTTAAWWKGAIRETDPNGDPWTVARLDGLQAGVVNTP